MQFPNIVKIFHNDICTYPSAFISVIPYAFASAIPKITSERSESRNLSSQDYSVVKTFKAGL